VIAEIYSAKWLSASARDRAGERSHLPHSVAEEQARAAALAVPNVVTAMAGKPPRKVIVVPNRIINVVV
jgi:leucyl-tRNA synthetase